MNTPPSPLLSSISKRRSAKGELSKLFNPAYKHVHDNKDDNKLATLAISVSLSMFYIVRYIIIIIILLEICIYTNFIFSLNSERPVAPIYTFSSSDSALLNFTLSTEPDGDTSEPSGASISPYHVSSCKCKPTPRSHFPIPPAPFRPIRLIRQHQHTSTYSSARFVNRD